MKACSRCGGMSPDNEKSCIYCGNSFPPEPKPPVNQYHNVSNTDQSRTVVNNYYGTPQPNGNQSRNEKPKKKNLLWKILGWLFIFPLMITLIAKKKKSKVWWAIAAVSWVVYAVLQINRETEIIDIQETATAVVETVQAKYVIPTKEDTPTPVPSLTPFPTLTLDTMPGIESWNVEPFYESFLSLTGFPKPEVNPGEEGEIYSAMDVSNDQYKMIYHTTVNKDGKIAEAFFNVTGKNASGILGEIAALSAVRRDYQEELQALVNDYSGGADIEKTYGDAWYKVTSNGDDVYMLIINHVQYNDYLHASSTPVEH